MNQIVQRSVFFCFLNWIWAKSLFTKMFGGSSQLTFRPRAIQFLCKHWFDPAFTCRVPYVLLKPQMFVPMRALSIRVHICIVCCLHVVESLFHPMSVLCLMLFYLLYSSSRNQHPPGISFILVTICKLRYKYIHLLVILPYYLPYCVVLLSIYYHIVLYYHINYHIHITIYFPY